MKDAWIALGANLGNREATIARAVERLARVPGFEVVRLSSLQVSQADLRDGGGDGEWPPFLNAVLRGRTSLAPRLLLWHLLRIEAELGRRRGPRPVPRTLDLDLLALGDTVIQQADLTLPHPRLCGRSFVLEPLAREFPEWRLAGDGRTAAELLRVVQPGTTAGSAPDRALAGPGRPADGGVG